MADDSDFCLACEQVHVWTALLDDLASCTLRFKSVLGPDEISRAKGFRNLRQRNRFIGRRTLRRLLLSLYTGQAPGAISFSVGSNGKPALAASSPRVSFNGSSANDVVVLALTLEHALGIDIEMVRDSSEREAMIAAFASRAERESWLRVRRDERALAFVRWWTLKEAFLKATGLGVSLPLDAFDVLYMPGCQLEIGALNRGLDTSRVWTALAIDRGGTLGAVVAEGQVTRLVEYDLTLDLCEELAARYPS